MIPILKYPVFESNQLLTAKQLNNLFNYLDQQNRLTRTHLIGIGIVCGLELDNPAANVISISRGCGITSQGYLLILEDCRLTHYKPYTLPDKLHDPFSANPDKASLYKPFYADLTSMPPTPYALWELLGKDDFAPEDVADLQIKPLGEPSGFLEDKAVILFLEAPLEPLKNCIEGDCDDKGQECRGRIRKLLIRIEDLRKIIAAAEAGAGAEKRARLRREFGLPDLFLPRFDVQATAIGTLDSVFDEYHSIINEVLPKAGEAIQQLFTVYRPAFGQSGQPLPNATALLGQHLNRLNNNFPLGIQYFYDFLGDLIEAYVELREAAFDMLVACSPPDDWFPKHLMLGKALGATDEQPSEFRHYFIHSPIHNQDKERLAEVKSLFQRLEQMLSWFAVPVIAPNDRPEGKIRITPSRYGYYPLSRKAMPYYYQIDPAHPLWQYWDYRKIRKGKADQTLSYHANQYSAEEPVIHPLEYDLETYDFYRVEGHIGLNKEAVLPLLKELKSLNRLPIEFISLELNTPAATQTLEYLRRHPGINHRAGVPRGGTFVLLFMGRETVLPVPNVQILNTLDEPFDLTVAGGGQTVAAIEGLDHYKSHPVLTLPENTPLQITLSTGSQTLPQPLTIPAGIGMLGLINKETGILTHAPKPRIVWYPGALFTTEQKNRTRITFIHQNRSWQEPVKVIVDNLFTIAGKLNFSLGLGQRTESDPLQYLDMLPRKYQFQVFKTGADSRQPWLTFDVDFSKSAGEVVALLLIDEGGDARLLGIRPNGNVRAFSSTPSLTIPPIDTSPVLPANVPPRRLSGSQLIAAGTVVADLFLPYLCCTGGEDCDLPCGGDTEVGRYSWPMINREMYNNISDGNALQLKVKYLKVNDKLLVESSDPRVSRIEASELDATLDPAAFKHNFLVISHYLNLITEGRLLFAGESEPPGNAGFITIKRYACQNFELLMEIVFLNSREQAVVSYNVKYSQEGFFVPPEELNKTKEVLQLGNICGCTLPAFGFIEKTDYNWIYSEGQLMKIFAEGYRFNILEYTVGTQVLVSPNTPQKTIDVTGALLQSLGLQAVLNQLNEAFPNGLHFSCERDRYQTEESDPEKSRFSITRSVADPFVLKITDERLLQKGVRYVQYSGYGQEIYGIESVGNISNVKDIPNGKMILLPLEQRCQEQERTE